ncbi:hypothetical protein SCLCIDRAFT_1213817 [Scleroderma citrinum Foug A]|uniref:Uncharacterized protein n=1 Tax=Scleroderma citrinum Foug A TaxID=1036808 RepID=A0A0C3E6C4_9AGAM|nr:hypothetical protein SCLCIDRAFT_1213817 [Scleroderma citrinum Foug A]
MHTLAFSLGFQPATTPLNPSSDISGFTSLEIPMGAVIRTANYDIPSIAAGRRFAAFPP